MPEHITTTNDDLAGGEDVLYVFTNPDRCKMGLRELRDEIEFMINLLEENPGSGDMVRALLKKLLIRLG